MKLFKAIAATACALAVASAAQAETYTDSSANYPGGEGGLVWETGANGGSGFGAWTISTTSGSDGWAGCGIWDPSANEFQGSWAGKTAAFGLMGKGDGFSVTASRPFRKALAAGDSFSLEMAVNWDSDREGALKGFVLTAGGEDVVTVNHGANPGKISVNGDDTSDILNAYGVNPMVWTFTVKDDTTISVTATARDDASKVYEADLAGLATSAIDGFRLQSAEQNNQNEDRRQSYYDNFVLEIAGELPDLVDLTFTSGEWAVSSAAQTLSYTLSRSSSDGALEVSVKSSDEAFVPSATVSFDDGESEKEFTLDATLTGSGNYAKLTASATGCNPAVYEVKGPQYRISASTADLFAGDSADLWINWDNNGIRDDSKLAFVADPEGVVSIPEGWALPEEGDDIYVQTSVSALAEGFALLALEYDGVKMGDWGFTVRVPAFSISGPASVKAGTVHDYTLSVVTKNASEPAEVSATGGASVDPASFDEVYPDTPVTFSVTFPETAGTVILSAATPEGDLAVEFPVTVSEPVDPSKFDDFVAYDDASLYDEGFDFDANGAGQEGFQAWGVYKTGAEYGGTFVGGDDGGFPAILTDGKTMAIYANGGASPDYAIFRPFVNDLQPGQKASVEFVVPEGSGTLYVQFARVWEGVPYSRFEAYVSDYNVGVNINGAAGDSKALGWSANPRRIVASVQRAADGSDYTLKLFGYNEGSELPDDLYTHVVDSDVGEWYDGIQGIVIGAYNMGGGENMPFNKLAISQEEEPVKVRTIGIMGTWNMDATGDYDFAVGPSEAGDPIGTVALAVTPDDGRVVLSAASVDVPGDDVAPFTVTVTSLPGEGEENVTYTITATPADTEIPPAEFNLTPTAAYLSLTSENWEHTTDETEIWLCLRASPSFYGTYAITSEDDAVLAVPDASASIDVNEGQTEAWFSVTIEGVGQARIYATMGETVRDYGFTINQGADVEQPEIPAPVAIAGKGLSWDASILDDGFVLRGTATLGESPDKDSWTDLVEGTDYVVEEGQVVVLYSSAYNYIALLKK